MTAAPSQRVRPGSFIFGCFGASSASRSPLNGELSRNSSVLISGFSLMVGTFCWGVVGSFMTECLDGPELGRPVGRVAAEEQADDDGHAQGQDDGGGHDHG